MAEKARYWVGVVYPENMVDNWQDIIAEKLQVPFAYCYHDKDHLSEYNKKYDDERKKHAHIMIAYNNTTTYNSALSCINSLSKDGCKCCNKVEVVRSVRQQYEYLIHNTEDSKKKGKYQYSNEERITGNLFDIGNYEQISTADKMRFFSELCALILDNGITNFADFYLIVCKMGSEYLETAKSNTSFLKALIEGNYHKMKRL